MTYKIWTVYKSGGEYTVNHVKWLQKQVKTLGYELFVLSDESLKYIAPFKMLRFNYQGWWSKMELFRPGFEKNQDIVFCDLDTVLLNKFDYLFNHNGSILMNDTYRQGDTVQSCLMKLTYQDRLKVWKYWAGQAEYLMQEYQRGGDQMVVQDVLNGVDKIQDVYPNCIKSFKFKNNKRKPNLNEEMIERPDCDIVIFSGKPRPWDVKRSWI